MWRSYLLLQPLRVYFHIMEYAPYIILRSELWVFHSSHLHSAHFGLRPWCVFRRSWFRFVLASQMTHMSALRILWWSATISLGVKEFSECLNRMLEINRLKGNHEEFQGKEIRTSQWFHASKVWICNSISQEKKRELGQDEWERIKTSFLILY